MSHPVDVSRPPLWMLSAEIGAGKTTFCRALAEAGRAAGWDVAGLLSPPVFAAGGKRGIAAHALRTGETRLLAQRGPAPGFDLAIGRWYFDREVFAWGNAVLASSLPCDLLLVDELGPLELYLKAGWQAALSALRGSQYRLGVVVIRPDLVVAAQEQLPICGTLPPVASLPSGAGLRDYLEQLKVADCGPPVIQS